MNFVKLYIGDYLRDTGTLTLAQHGAYMLMLLEHYATEKPLPVGRELHRLLRADSKAERDAIDFVAAKFWTLTETGLVNNRADKEIERASNQRAINQEIGKRGGRPKRTEQITESVTESVTETEPNRNPNQTPDTRQRERECAPTARPRGTRLPSGWSPSSDALDWTKAEKPGLDPLQTLEKFRDYWTAQPGQKGVKTDWDATWRNWVRREIPPAGGLPANGQRFVAV